MFVDAKFNNHALLLLLFLLILLSPPFLPVFLLAALSLFFLFLLFLFLFLLFMFLLFHLPLPLVKLLIFVFHVSTFKWLPWKCCHSPMFCLLQSVCMCVYIYLLCNNVNNTFACINKYVCIYVCVYVFHIHVSTVDSTHGLSPPMVRRMYWFCFFYFKNI